MGVLLMTTVLSLQEKGVNGGRQEKAGKGGAARIEIRKREHVSDQDATSNPRRALER